MCKNIIHTCDTNNRKYEIIIFFIELYCETIGTLQTISWQHNFRQVYPGQYIAYI